MTLQNMLDVSFMEKEFQHVKNVNPLLETYYYFVCISLDVAVDKIRSNYICLSSF